jgi:hypothetical protein
MKTSLMILLAAPALRVSAFTMGKLIPAYICAPLGDGMPKSFGALLPLTRNQLPTVAYNPDPGMNTNPAPMFNATAPSMIANSAYILASCHNSFNTIEAIQQGVQVTTVSGGPIIAGLPNALNLSSGTAGVAIDGTLIYATDAMGTRVGSFADMASPPVFEDFPGCGLSKQGQMAGVVQSGLISDNSFYSTLHFNAPIDLQGTVMFIGLSVTDNGFGVFNFTLPVTPCISAGGTVVAATVPSAVTKPAASASAKPYQKARSYWK